MKKISIVVLVLYLIFTVVSCEEGTVTEYGIFKDPGTMYLGITSKGSISASSSNEDRDKIYYVKIPSKYAGINVVEIHDYGFRYCEKLTRVFIDYSCSRIGNNAFECCKQLSWVSIPITIIEIGDNAFNDCPNLEKIYYDGTKEEWDSISKGLNWKDPKISCTVVYEREDNLTEVI